VKDTAPIEFPTQEAMQIDLIEMFRGAVRLALEAILEQQVRDMVGGGKWQRLSNRRDLRNGSYFRRLLTSMGLVEVRVPRTRESGSPVEVFGRYRRRQSEVDEAIAQAYVNGVSTRGMGDVTEALLGETVDRSTVSRVTKRLDDQVEQLRKAPITDTFPYLFLDGTFLDARWARKVENVSALVAYGVNSNGDRRMLAVTIGSEESEESWTELIRQLIDRGLRGVDLVVADAHAGLAAAVRHHFPEARQQRCVVHFLRNILAKVPHRLQARLARELSPLFKAGSLVEAKRRLEDLRHRFVKHVPEAIAILDAGFPAATQFYAFPRSHWRKIRSTNGLERLNAEIKRRIRSVGAFPDRASALRLITAVVLRATRSWATRRYLGDMRVHRKEQELKQAA